MEDQEHECFHATKALEWDAFMPPSFGMPRISIDLQ
jgi:hypothetical protein